MYRKLKYNEENKIGLTLNFNTRKIKYRFESESENQRIPLYIDYKEELPETVQFTWEEYPNDVDYDITINCVLERFDYMCRELRDKLLKKLKGKY